MKAICQEGRKCQFYQCVLLGREQVTLICGEHINKTDDVKTWDMGHFNTFIVLLFKTFYGQDDDINIKLKLAYNMNTLGS